MFMKTDLERALTAIQSGTKSFSNKELRILLVRAILDYFEGKILLRNVFPLSIAIHKQTSTPLDTDITDACTHLEGIQEQLSTGTIHSFLAHQHIEDQLVTILNSLQKTTPQQFNHNHTLP